MQTALALIALLVPVTVGEEAPPPPSASGAPSTQPSAAPQPVGVPVPDGPAQECHQSYDRDNFYARNAFRPYFPVSAISFEIGVDGTVSHVTVLRPSGVPILDNAALACAAQWHYKPATLNGQPVAMPWQTWMGWHPSSATQAVAMADAVPPPPPLPPAPLGTAVGRPHTCATYYPEAEIRLGIEGTTVLGFDVKTDGWVHDFTILRSSGNQDLDLASVACASHWHYKPATRDHKPVEASWQAAIVWKLHDGQPPPDAKP